jgi:hypothetical protein
MPTERPPLVGEVVPTFADRRCCVVEESKEKRMKEQIRQLKNEINRMGEARK